MIKAIFCADSRWAMSNGKSPICDLTAHKEKVSSMVKGANVFIGFSYYVSIGSKPVEGANKTFVMCPCKLNLNNCICITSINEIIDYIRHEKEDLTVLGGYRLLRTMYMYYNEVYVTQLNSIIDGGSNIFYEMIDMVTDSVVTSKSELHTENGIDFYDIKFERYIRSK